MSKPWIRFPRPKKFIILGSNFLAKTELENGRNIKVEGCGGWCRQNKRR